LTVDDASLVGACDVGYSCAYSSTLSWLTPTLPLMAENNPRVVFERLFGVNDSTDARARASRLQQDRSILDSITDRVKTLQRKLGAADNRKVNDYLASLRDVERRIQKAEEQSSKDIPGVERPVGIPDGFEPHVELLYDLQLLAFQSDLTRVTTFMYGAEQRARMYPEIGLNESHHSMSHHGNAPDNLAKYTKLCTWHVELFAYLVEKMRNTPDGDGTLLDHSLLMIGGGMSDGNIHSHMDVPIALVGGANGFKGNQHMAMKMGTPLSNLLVAVANHSGVPIDSFGDSSSAINLRTT